MSAVALLAKEPASTAIFTDFDGTLAPIVHDPATSRILPGALDVLGRLTESFAVVAVISGRPGNFLRDLLELPQRVTSPLAFGLYGLERADRDGVSELTEDAELWREVVSRAYLEAKTQLPARARVEDKGLSLVLHWRDAPELEEILSTAAGELGTRYGLVAHRAKMAIELSPGGAPDKGTVVATLARGCRAACFIGDDAGDVPAFLALSQLSLTESVRAVKVAVLSDELPAELLAAADIVLEGPDGVLAFLEALTEQSEQDQTKL